METLRTICADIAIDLKQVKDDLEIPDRQLWYWVLFTADRLRMLHIQKRRSGAFLSTFILPVTKASPFPDRPFVTLPVSIYDFDLDAGVESLSYYDEDECGPGFKKVILARTSPSEMRWLGKSVYQKSCNNPQYWREHEKLYLDGVSPELENIEAKLYATLPDFSDVDPDAPLDFPKELLMMLKSEVLRNGRFALALPGQYLTNDGTNRPRGETPLAPQTTSVNNEVAQSPL